MPLNIDWHQILIHLFNYFLLMAILTFFLYQPIVSFMEKRRKHYEEIDRDAMGKREEAEKLLEENKRIYEDSDRELKEYRDKQIEETSRLVQEKLDVARDEASKIIIDAKSKASMEHEKIVESANKDIKQMAIELTKKLVKNGDDVYDEFIASSLAGDKKDE